jgi:CheY-like chemotaxis protein
MHGGSIRAISAGHGKGTVFVVELPVSTGSIPEEEVVARSAPIALQNRLIIVVDDNRDSAVSMCQLLTMMGYRAVPYFGGKDGLDAVLDGEPSIAFVDIGMPDMSGLEVAEQIRKRFGPDQVRLIAMTGWGTNEDKRRSLLSGFDFHLTKPVTLDALREVLESVKEDPSLPK